MKRATRILGGLALQLSVVLRLLGAEEAVGQGKLPPLELVRLMRMARLAEMENRHAEALELLRQAAETHPAELTPVIALWQYDGRNKLPAEEAAKLRQLLTTRLADAASPLPPGVLGYVLNDPDAGAEQLDLILQAASRRLEAAGDDFELLQAIAWLQSRLDRPEEARRSMGRMLAIRPSPELAWDCVWLDLELERWDDAARLLHDLVGDEETSGYGRMTYVEVLGKTGRHEELIRQLALMDKQGLTTGLEDRGTLADLLLQVAWDLRDLGQDAKAEAIFRKLLATDPTNAEARGAILHLYSSEEERQAQREALAQQWKAADDPHALLAEGSQLLAVGDAASAFDLLQRAAELQADSEVAWYNLGLAAMKLERWENAEQAFARAATLHPDRAETLLNQGISLYNLSRCPEAILTLERALSLKAPLPAAHYYLHHCHKALGHEQEMRRHLELYNKGG